MYVCLNGYKNGFRAGCCPLIGLDGAFLKTMFGGQILSAVAQDANHHIYVIAWAIMEVENTVNWKWFLELLHQDLGDYKTHSWYFISDMQKGLIHAMQEVMPNVHHRFCVWHIWRNFNKQWKDIELWGLLWDCAQATTFEEFKEHRKKMKWLNADAWAYLEKWPTHSWTRSQFSHRPKLDSICNNACKVFNAKKKEVRRKPIIILLEESRLEKVRKECKHWQPIWAGDTSYEKFEVHGHLTNHVVDLRKRLRILCVHACAAIARVNKHPEDFCHKLLTMDLYKATYSHHINPLPGQQLWERSENNRHLAPFTTRNRGSGEASSPPTPESRDQRRSHGHSERQRAELLLLLLLRRARRLAILFIFVVAMSLSITVAVSPLPEHVAVAASCKFPSVSF
ncbi:uncharacterized protein [Arachis hypogaea]|uniref:uncharacterized protein n=1 Tax=Arachis hypogaea TaxID=3818 RepID=UPI003B20E62D